MLSSSFSLSYGTIPSSLISVPSDQPWLTNCHTLDKIVSLPVSLLSSVTDTGVKAMCSTRCIYSAGVGNSLLVIGNGSRLNPSAFAISVPGL